MERFLTGEAETDIKYKNDAMLELCPQYTNIPYSDIHNLVELRRVEGRSVKCMLNEERAI